MTLTAVGAAYVEYIRAIAVKAARCEALVIVSQCNQCGSNRPVAGYTKLDGTELELCEPCVKGAR